MICDTEDSRAVLKDTCDKEEAVKELQVTSADWKQLRDIKIMLQPFQEYTEFVSRIQLSIQLSARMYLILEQTLRGISKREREYTRFNASLADTVKVGLAKFEEYNRFMQSNNIYYIASILDLRIKCQ
jgi:hypothetical protein